MTSPLLIASLVQVSYNRAFGLWAHSPHGATVAIAASGTINGIILFVLMPVFGLTQGMQPIVGYNYGARNLHRVEDVFLLSRFFGVRSICFAGPISDALSACVSMTVIFFEIRRLRRMQDPVMSS